MHLQINCDLPAVVSEDDFKDMQAALLVLFQQFINRARYRQPDKIIKRWEPDVTINKQNGYASINIY